MTTNPSSCRTVLRAVFFSLLASLSLGSASAQVQKYRGHILEIDAEKKTLTIEHAKQGKLTLKYNNDTRVPGPNEIGTLKPGMFVISVMSEDDKKVIAVIRHDPEQDKKEDK